MKIVANAEMVGVNVAQVRAMKANDFREGKVNYTSRFLLLMSVLAIYGFCGCVGIEIVDVDSDSSKFISSGKYREIIAHINENKKIFKTLQRIIDNKFQIRTIGFDGEILGEEKIPYFEGPYYMIKFAFSPDGTEIVYPNMNNNGIHLLNIKSKRNKLLLKNVSHGGHSIADMHFISNDTLIMMLEKDKDVMRNDYGIVRYDLNSA